WYSKDGGLFNARMFTDNLFDLLTVNILCAADYHVFETIYHGKVPLSFHASKIPCMYPAVLNSILRLLFHPVVAFHAHGPVLSENLANTAHGCILPVFIHDPYFGAAHLAARTPRSLRMVARFQDQKHS